MGTYYNRMQKRSKSTEQLDFEIRFYERLLATHPQFAEALMALGEAYTRRGWHEKGLTVDLKLTQLKATDPVVWYNLACSYALLNRLDDSFASLSRAIDLGYNDFEHLLNDPDLSLLRQSPKLRHLLERQAHKPTA